MALPHPGMWSSDHMVAGANGGGHSRGGSGRRKWGSNHARGRERGTVCVTIGSTLGARRRRRWGSGVTEAMTSTMAAMEELGAHGEDDPRSWSLLWRTPKSSVVHKYAIGAAGIGRHASTESNRRRRSELRGGADALWRSVLDISGQNRQLVGQGHGI